MDAELYCVWYRILHRQSGTSAPWSKLPRAYPTQSEANHAVASRARMSGALAEFLVLPEGKSPS